MMKWIKIILAALPVFLFLFLFSRYFVFSGQLHIVYDMEKHSPYISLLPEDRISDPTQEGSVTYRLAEAEPLYMDIRTPRSFQTARISIFYSNETQDIIELGGLVDRVAESYIFQAVENQYLDNLSWPMIVEPENGRTLWQRVPRFESIEAFLEELPEKDEIVVYQYDLGPDYDTFSKLVDLEKSEKQYVIAGYVKNYPSQDGFPNTSRGRVLRQKSLSFNLGPIQYSQYHKYRFVLSAPGVDASKNLRLYRLEVFLEREPVTWKSFFRKGMRFVLHAL